MKAGKVGEVVRLDEGTRAAYGWLPVVSQVDRVLCSPTGDLLRVSADGGVEPILPGGHPRPGPASDPMNRRGDRRGDV